MLDKLSTAGVNYAKAALALSAAYAAYKKHPMAGVKHQPTGGWNEECVECAELLYRVREANKKCTNAWLEFIREKNASV